MLVSLEETLVEIGDLSQCIAFQSLVRLFQESLNKLVLNMVTFPLSWRAYLRDSNPLLRRLFRICEALISVQIVKQNLLNDLLHRRLCLLKKQLHVLLLEKDRRGLLRCQPLTANQHVATCQSYLVVL